MDKLIYICDFDGTITKKDTINDFLEQFADKKWLEIEKDWIEGKIGTCEAMRSQFGLIKNMTLEKFNNFFEQVELDDYFIDFYNYTKEQNIPVAIVSDGFDYFIKRILEKNSINDIEIYSNHFEYNNGNFIMEFPNKKENCRRNAGTCKCTLVDYFKNQYRKVYYVGDGVSDFCVAGKADLLFAKNKLLCYCEEKNIECIKYNNFNQVMKNGKINN